MGGRSASRARRLIVGREVESRLGGDLEEDGGGLSRGLGDGAFGEGDGLEEGDAAVTVSCAPDACPEGGDGLEGCECGAGAHGLGDAVELVDGDVVLVEDGVDVDAGVEEVEEDLAEVGGVGVGRGCDSAGGRDRLLVCAVFEVRVAHGCERMAAKCTGKRALAQCREDCARGWWVR